MTVGLVETQGETMTGTQGIGVSTPKAAAVAEATLGFDKVLHIPNGIIFTIGIKSVTEATGNPQIKIGNFGRTTNEDGAAPNVHLHIAPQTPTAITAGLIKIYTHHQF